MDRNTNRNGPYIPIASVALRKESVDRNIIGEIIKVVAHVALRKESVDRNDDPATSD